MINIFNILFNYFETPYIILLIIPIIIILIYLIKKDFVKIYSLNDIKKRKIRNFALISRIFIFLLLIIALASPYVETTKIIKGDPKIKILIDNSTSMGLFDLDFISSLVANLEKRIPTEIYEAAEGEESNLGDGILSNLRKDDNLLLITDGNNNKGLDMGDVALQASILNSSISSLIINPDKFDASVYIIGPEKTTAKAENTFTVVIKKTENKTVKLVVDIDGSNVFNENTNEEKISVKKAFQEGYHKISAKIEVNDHFKNNNIYYKTIKVVPKPRILLFTNHKELGDLFNPLYEVEKVNSLSNKFDNYTAVVIGDIPADLLDSNSSVLADYITEGNGMFVVGGKNSYDFGDYNNSRFEDLLPAFVAKAGRQKGEVNVVFVLDISQSTGDTFGGYTKVDVEKALAIAMLRNISLAHNVGFVAFNTQAYKLANLKPLREHNDLEDKVAELKFFGGTDISNGLLAAIDMLQNSGGSKNIILISDGRNNKGSDEVIETSNYASSLGIRIYTVGVGFDTHTPFMKQIADITNAAYFEPSTSQQIKLVFGDTEISANKRVFPLDIINEDHFITENLDLNAKIYGFNQIVPKNSAKMLVTTDVGDPILVVWRYGLGRVASLATDTSTFGSELLNKDNSILLTRITNWVIGDPERKNTNYIDISDGRVGNNVDIIVKSNVQPASEEAAFYKFDENLFRGTIFVNDTGFRNMLGSVFAVNYKLEYQDIGVNPELESVVMSTSGKMFYADNAEEIAEFIKQKSRREISVKKSYSWVLLLAALILFLIEITIRRLVVYKII